MVNIRNSPALLVLLHLAIADLGSSIYFCILISADLMSISRGNLIFDYDYATTNQKHYSLTANTTTNRTAVLKITWIFSYLCSIARFFSQIGLGCANIFTFYITLRRYLALFYPMRCQKLNMICTKLFICLAWSISLIFTLGLTIGSIIIKKPEYILKVEPNIIFHLCQPVTIAYVLILSVVEVIMNTFLSLASIFLYIAISYKIWPKLKPDTSDLIYKIQQRIHIMLACIVLTNAVVFLPITFFMIGAIIKPPNLNKISLYWPIAALLTYSNCLIDPLLFIFFSFTYFYRRSLRSRRIIRP